MSIYCFSVGFPTVGTPTLCTLSITETEPGLTEPAADDEFQYLAETLARKPAEVMPMQQQSPIERQLDSYFALTAASNFSQKGEPSKFWIDRADQYPELSTFALDVLIIQCSSAPSERLFSTAGEATSGKKNRLSGERLEQKVFVRRNAKYL